MNNSSRSNETLSQWKVFLPLWLGMLLSTSSLYVLLIALSAKSYEIWGSGLLAGAVFASQWMLPIALAPIITQVCATSSPRSSLIISELVSSLIVVGIAWSALDLPYVTFGLLVLRGFCDAITKTSRLLAIKHSTSEVATAKKSIAWLNTSFLAGTGLGALFGRLVAHLSIPEIALLAAAGFASAALIYRFAADAQPVSRVSNQWSLHLLTDGWKTWYRGFLAIREHGLTSHFVTLMASVGLFQAYHNIARTTIPVNELSGSAADVASFQLVTSIGLVIGSLLCSLGIIRGRSANDICWLLMTAALSIAVTTVSTIGSGLAVYFLFALAFEVAYVLSQSQLLAACPAHAAGIVVPFQHTFSLALLVAGVFLFGKVNDLFGIRTASFVAAVLAVASSAFIGASRTKEAHSEVNGTSQIKVK